MLTESQRRVIMHLSEPHSPRSLTRAALADPHSPFGEPDSFAQSLEQVEALLDGAVDQGWVVSVGSHSTGKDMAGAVASSGDAIDIDPGKMERRVARIDSGKDTRLDTGELFVLSKLGLEKLEA